MTDEYVTESVKDFVVCIEKVVDVITPDSESIVVVAGNDEVSIVTNSTPVKVITVGIQGPPGPGGSGSTIHYDKKADVFSDTVVYKGEAIPGTLSSSPAWQIKRIEILYGDQISTITTYPDSDKGYSFVWDNRATYNYG